MFLYSQCAHSRWRNSHSITCNSYTTALPRYHCTLTFGDHFTVICLPVYHTLMCRPAYHLKVTTEADHNTKTVGIAYYLHT